MPKWIDLNEVDDDLLLGNLNTGGKSIIQEQLAEKVSTYYQPASEDGGYQPKKLSLDLDEDITPKKFQSAMEDEEEGSTFQSRKFDVSWDEDDFPMKKWGSTGGASTYQASEQDFLDVMAPAKKSMTIFFLIDVSKSMKGTKIGSLNSTMEELLPSLVGVGEASTDVKIAVMKFSTQVEWVTPQPVKIEDYQSWNRLEPEGLTFMGDAFMELSKKLSRNSFLNSPSLSYAPVIFLLSDGTPNDNWQKGLKTLKENKWFQYGLKIALGIGSEVDMDVLRAFTGNDELAVQAKTADQLRELVKMLAVTSSQIGSRSLALVDHNPQGYGNNANYNRGGNTSFGRANTGFQGTAFGANTGASFAGNQGSYGDEGMAEPSMSQAKQQLLVQEIREGTRDILGEAVDLDSVNFDEGW